MTNQEKLLSAFKEKRMEDFETLLKYPDIDVDYFYGEPDNGTLLDLASRSQGNEQYVFELIRSGAKVWSKNGETGKLKIHEIFNNSDKHLLYNIWCGLYFSSRSGNNNANIMKVAVEENDIEAITLLVHSYSVVQSKRFVDEAQRLILLRGSIAAVRLFIKYFDVDKDFQKDSQGCTLTCREIILQKYPQLETEIPTFRTRSPSELQEILFLYLEKGVPELFVRRIAEISTELLNDGVQKYLKLTYLHVACEHNYTDVVDALLKKNISLNSIVPYYNKFAQNVTPIMLAAFEGHYEIFKKLSIIPEVELQNAGGSGSVWHLVLHGMRFMENHNRSTNGHREILELLPGLSYDNVEMDFLFIENRRLDIDHTDKSNRTALHYALKFNNEFSIKLLLNAGAKLYPKDQTVLTSISAAIIEGYFDDCIRLGEDSFSMWGYDDKPIVFEYKIFTQLDLCFIATKPQGNSFARFESVMRKLYKHPLTKSLLYVKWKLVRKYYYINLLFYLSFCLAVSKYIFQIQGCPPSSTNLNSSSGSTDTTINRDASSIECDVSLWMWLITFLLYVVLILRELCQFSVSIRQYFCISENWLGMTMIVVIGFLFANETNTHLAANAILMSWIGLILLLSKQPLLSIYMGLFKTLALNFVRFLLLYSILVASFAYSFFILFRNKTRGHASSHNQMNVNTKEGTNENSMNSWQSFGISFFKSLIMMTGEFDAANLPLDSNFSYDHLFVILFVLLVTTVFYNLFSGVVASDTRDILGDAEVVALISRAKLISQVERLALNNPFRNVSKCTRMIKPLERGYIFLRNKLFGNEVFIDETMPVHVYPTEGNTTEICGRNYGRMPYTIVKHAEEILEKRKQSKLVQNENENSLTDVTKNNSSEHQLVNDFVHQFSEQINDLKVEICAKNATRDEKLLQNVDQRFDKMMNELLKEQISDLKLEIDAKNASFGEKLLQNVDQRFGKIVNKLLKEEISDLKLEIDAKNAARDEKLLQNVELLINDLTK